MAEKKENPLSFNKRISLVKKDVFENLQKTKELDSIKGTDKIGFYSLSTIESYLFPALDKYNLDLDLEVLSDKIIGHWYDGVGDNKRDIEIDFHRIENVGKLQLMVHEVQSEGAVKSYTRRYALTAILRLPSTDLIDTQGPYEPGSSQSPVKVTEPQLKRYYAIAKAKNINIETLDDLIKAAFNIKSKKDWLQEDYKKFTDFMESDKGNSTTVIHALEEKIKKKLEKKEQKNNG